MAGKGCLSNNQGCSCVRMRLYLDNFNQTIVWIALSNSVGHNGLQEYSTIPVRNTAVVTQGCECFLQKWGVWSPSDSILPISNYHIKPIERLLMYWLLPIYLIIYTHSRLRVIANMNIPDVSTTAFRYWKRRWFAPSLRDSCVPPLSTLHVRHICITVSD